MAMADRMVVHPMHGAAWFFSACATDALVMAATEWCEPFSDLLDLYRQKKVRVLIRKEKDDDSV